MGLNSRHPAVKRIMQEMRELQSENSSEFQAEALEDNIFEWHFAIRGPPDTEFEGGIYHGRIILPSDYPFKPPEFIMLSPTGRWETNTKICLSISSHHPEHWQPSWSVRTALMALKAFMPTPANGALGSLDFPKPERQRLAARSRVEPPKLGTAERQAVIQSIHEKMLAANPPQKPQKSALVSPQDQDRSLPMPAEPAQPVSSRQLSQDRQPGDGQGVRVANTEETVTTTRQAEEPLREDGQSQMQETQGAGEHQPLESSWEERGLNYLAVGLLLAILAILGRKALAGIDIADFI